MPATFAVQTLKMRASMGRAFDAVNYTGVACLCAIPSDGDSTSVHQTTYSGA